MGGKNYMASNMYHPACSKKAIRWTEELRYLPHASSGFPDVSWFFLDPPDPFDGLL